MADDLSERQAEDEIAAALTRAGLDFVREASVEGLRPDFLISWGGRRVAIEVRSATPTLSNRRAAEAHAARYAEALGADAAFVVLPGDVKGGKHVLSKWAVVDAVKAELAKAGGAGSTVRSPASSQSGEPPAGGATTIFVAMPFATEYDDTYFVGIRGAADQLNMTCDRVDQLDEPGDIPNKIRRLITACSVVVADLSESIPNVLYEIGYAHGLGKPVVQICSTALKDLPLDVRNETTVKYNRGQTRQLTGDLVGYLRNLVVKP